jgi:hypothetical protein
MKNDIIMVVNVINNHCGLKVGTLSVFIEPIVVLIDDYSYWLDEIKMVSVTPENLIDMLLADVLVVMDWATQEVADNYHKMLFLQRNLIKLYNNLKPSLNVSEDHFLIITLSLIKLMVKQDEKNISNGVIPS